MQNTSIRQSGPQVAHHEPSPRQAAYLAGEQLITGRATATLLAYYKYLVKISGFINFLPSQEYLAGKFGVTSRTIRNYDARLVELGLIWTEREGHGLRRHIVVLDPQIEDEIEPENEAAPAVIVPLCEEASVASEPEGSIRLNRKETSGSSFKGDQIIKLGGLTPLPPRGGGGGYGYPREFIPETPATEILQREGVQSWRSLQLLADRPVDEIFAALTAIKKRRAVESVPGLLVHVLTGKRGLFKTKEELWADGEGWSDGGAAPPVPDLPSFCPECGAICPAEWEGHCLRCEPQLFEPAGGVT